MTLDPSTVLRLVMPQWQGGDEPEYRVGTRVLTALAPAPRGPVETIAVPEAEGNDRQENRGIVSREALLDQLAQAKDAIARHQPHGIVTLGGDCLVDLAPIAYLADRYPDDLAVLWVDAHPDVMGAEQFPNAHAHVLAMLMGEGDSDFVAAVPRQIAARDILLVGLTETTPYETDFIARHGIARLSPEQLAGTVQPVIEWIRASGKSRIAVHFDLDVLDPAHYDFLLFRKPDAAVGMFDGVAKGRMTMEAVQAILAAVALEAEIVGLAITEYLPWSAIMLADELSVIPLLGSPAD
jgi:arginase